jgi:hypothetical protein
MSRRIILSSVVGIILAVVTHLSTQQVYACTIGPGSRPTPSEELARSDAVFIGTVAGVNEPAYSSYSGKTAVRLEATAIWKGPNQHTIVVYANYSPEVATTATHPDRHFVAELAIGREYLIFASREKGTGILITDRRTCSYIKGGIIPYSLADVEDLGPPLFQGEHIGVGMPIAGGKSYELMWVVASVALLCTGAGLLMTSRKHANKQGQGRSTRE